MVFDRYTGNGNGNKMNLRVTNLENLLAAQISDSGPTYETNSLKQVIRRNKTGFADDAPSSLDIMRKIYQPKVNEELRLVLEKYIEVFRPAFENLQRNKHEATQQDKNELCCNFLENAKKMFLPLPGSRRQSNGSELSHLKRTHYESEDGSEMSILSPGPPEHKKRRGRPRKEDEILLSAPHPVSQQDIDNWNANRLNGQPKFVYTTMVAPKMGIKPAQLFENFPRMFRYICDNEDKTHLFEARLLRKLEGKVIIMLYEDALSLVGQCPDLYSNAFITPDSVLRKIRHKAAKTQEQLNLKVQPPPPNLFGFNF